jgi:hypothetical protein
MTSFIVWMGWQGLAPLSDTFMEDLFAQGGSAISGLDSSGSSSGAAGGGGAAPAAAPTPHATATDAPHSMADNSSPTATSVDSSPTADRPKRASTAKVSYADDEKFWDSVVASTRPFFVSTDVSISGSRHVGTSTATLAGRCSVLCFSQLV